MIRAGLSTPQTVTLTGTGFPAGAVVLVTKPGCTTSIEVTPSTVTSTLITLLFTFDVEGEYSFVVTDPTGLCDTCPSDPFLLTPEPLDCPDVRAFKTFGELKTETMHKLGDDNGAIWSADEVGDAILDGYDLIATQFPVFWDQAYLENLPRGFSVTQPWELLQLGSAAIFNYGVANFTAEFERRAGASIGFDERQRYGPANHTSPFEATDLLLSRAVASTAIPATSELSKRLTRLDRVLWDNRTIDALEPRSYAPFDAVYETQAGEVYGYTWAKDGVRTLRKIKVPAVQSASLSINGSWGTLRNPEDISTDTIVGTWGICRRVPGHHPLGPDLFGAPRRFFLESMNVRVEHFRLGRLMDADHVECELPPRYALYLRDFAQGTCYGRPGPGYDKTLSEHFFSRWERGLKRIERRLTMVNTERVGVMGGDGRPSVRRPAHPRLPWPYGSTVR